MLASRIIRVLIMSTDYH